MSNPRVKRAFAGNAADPAQRQITSFFNPRSSTDTTEGVRSPPLPANVQSNLLSVGMRVRKSVPEGYKTSGHSAFKLWTDDSITLSSAKSPAPRSASRELLPFCGINRVGGLDCQAGLREVDDEEDHTPGLDDVPELTMSQESTDSAISTKSARKRSYGDEILDPVQPWIGGTPSKWDAEVSPGSLTSAGVGNARVMAIPRSRATRRASAAALQKDVDQENMVADQDFEDADFLVYGREMDLTG